MQKTFIWGLFSIIGVTFAILILQSKSSDLESLGLKNFNSNQQKVLRIGIMDWPGFYPMLLALKDPRMKEQNFKVQLYKLKDNITLNSYVESGKLDLSFGTFADHLLMRGNDRKVKFIYATDFSKSDVFMANKAIQSFSDLKNKKIGITSSNSFSEFFILNLFALHKIPEEDLSLKVIPFDEVTEALDSKVIHAGHTWEPETNEALEKGYHILASSNEIKGIITDGLMATENSINNQFKEISYILSLFNEHLSRIKEINQEDISYLASEFQTTEKNVKEGIAIGVEFLSASENLKIFTGKEDYSLPTWAKKISDFYTDRGQIHSEVTPSDILDSSIIEEILKVSKNEVKN